MYTAEYSSNFNNQDTVPQIGGDTLWASGYAAYEKLSPDFRKMIDGKYAVYRSAHQYVPPGINCPLTLNIVGAWE
jgi:alpha-ketoglutarate-dependent taurine dioxygenase